MYSSTHKSLQKAPENLNENELVKCNKIVAKLVAKCLQYFECKPPGDIKCNLGTNVVTENEWIRLLLQNIFDGCAMSFTGCEGKSISQADEQRTKIAGQPCVKYIVGSMYEGVGCASPDEYSDTDIMNVLECFQAFHEESDIHPEHLENDISKATDTVQSSNCRILPDKKIIQLRNSTNPGYAQILKNKESEDLLKIAESLNFGPVIRSSKTENLLAHKFEFDNAISVECKTWPSSAVNWETRERFSGWPNKELILQCLKLPCTIVSKSHPMNLNDKYEWRFSFTRQEGLLIRSLPIEVRMVYIVSKVLLKQTIFKESTLSSYHLKTTFLWFCEDYGKDRFMGTGLETNIQRFLKFLLEQLHARRIAHYFIDNRNMVSYIRGEEIEKVEFDLAYFLSHLLEEILYVRTAVQYPFSTCTIAERIMKGLSESELSLQKIQSNYLYISIEHLFKLYQPHFNLIWMYIKNVPFLVTEICKINSEGDQSTIQAAINNAEFLLKIYGKEWVKLATLLCSLVEINDPKLKESARWLMMVSFQAQNDKLTTAACIADTINLIAMQLGVSATESCCIALTDWVFTNKSQKDIFLFTAKEIFCTCRSWSLDNDDHLLACLVVVVNVFQLSQEDTEVGIASALRLHHSLDKIKIISTFCNLIKKADLNNALKHLVYLPALMMEPKGSMNETNDGLIPVNTSIGTLKSQAKHEIGKAFETIDALVSSNVLKTSTDTFRFVLAGVVFQKLTLDPPDAETVKAVLQEKKASKISEDNDEIKEIQTDIENLLQTDEPDLGMVFQFLVFYTRKSITSAGLPFTSSVLDELVKPHYNLGILAAVGRELIAVGNIEESIKTIELWIERSTGAPIRQNPILRVKMYGNLGHCYHIKAMNSDKHDEKEGWMRKSAVLFRSAMKEKEKDIAVEVDFLLFLLEQESYDDFEVFLTNACFSGEITSLSNYYSTSKQLMHKMEEIKEFLEVKGQLNISSVAFANYIAICFSAQCKDMGTDTSPKRGNELKNEYLSRIKACVNILSIVYKQMKTTGSESSNDLQILADTTMLLSLAAKKLGMYELASKSLEQILELNQNDKFVKTKNEELKNLILEAKKREI